MKEASRRSVRLEVNVIFRGHIQLFLRAVCHAGKETQREAFPTVVVDMESDPLRWGYIKNLAHQRNLTGGVFLESPQLSGKQLGLKEMFPADCLTIAIFRHPRP